MEMIFMIYIYIHIYIYIYIYISMRFYDLTVCLVCLKVGCTSLPKKNAKLKIENMKKKHWMLLVHHWMLLVPDFRQWESSLRDSMDWLGKIWTPETIETIDLAVILWGFPAKIFPNQSIEPWFTVIFHYENYENPKIHGFWVGHPFSEPSAPLWKRHQSPPASPPNLSLTSWPGVTTEAAKNPVETLKTNNSHDGVLIIHWTIKKIYCSYTYILFNDTISINFLSFIEQ